MDTQGEKILVIITGASRGFGRALALEFASSPLSGANFHMILIARSASDLQETKRLVLQDGQHAQQSPSVTVETVVADLGSIVEAQTCIDNLFDRIPSENYTRAYLFNNAGSVGQLGFVQELASLEAVHNFMALNLSIPIWMCRGFLKKFGSLRDDMKKELTPPEVPVYPPPPAAQEIRSSSSLTKPSDNALPSVIVNVSSLAAKEPFQSWGPYCSAKAARNMLHHVIAVEQQDVSKLKALNFAPGPLDTDMQREIRESDTVYGPQKEHFNNAFKNGSLVNVRASARKCIELLHHNKFASGSHIDYFDL